MYCSQTSAPKYAQLIVRKTFGPTNLNKLKHYTVLIFCNQIRKTAKTLAGTNTWKMYFHHSNNKDHSFKNRQVFCPINSIKTDNKIALTWKFNAWEVNIKQWDETFVHIHQGCHTKAPWIKLKRLLQSQKLLILQVLISDIATEMVLISEIAKKYNFIFLI